MDYDFAPADIESEEQRKNEIDILSDIAEKIGLYDWEYKDGFADEKGIDTKDHLGPTAQELQKVRGLDGAVSEDENGTLMIDNGYISMATLGIVAALARIVLENYYVDEGEVI